MKDWVGWQEVKAILIKDNNNAVKDVIIEDGIKHSALLCQDAVMVDQYPRDASRRKEFVEQGYIVGKSSGHGCNRLAASLLQHFITRRSVERSG